MLSFREFQDHWKQSTCTVQYPTVPGHVLSSSTLKH